MPRLRGKQPPAALPRRPATSAIAYGETRHGLFGADTSVRVRTILTPPSASDPIRKRIFSPTAATIRRYRSSRHRAEQRHGTPDPC